MPETTPTHCPYCALQCGMALTQSADRLTVEGNADFPTSRGGLCAKGWTSAELLTHPDRLTSPLMRETRTGDLRPVSWDVAVSRIATELQAPQARYGLDSVGVFGGGGLTNEKAYLLGKFARVALRTSRIDYNGRFCMSAAAAANVRAFGIDRGLPFPLEDIATAGAIMLVGSNAGETMPPVMRYFERQRSAGGALIVVDPRSTPTARSADLYLQITPGTDVALANGLLYIAIQDGLIDRDFIAGRTTGFEVVRRAVSSYWPDRVERITGIGVHKLVRAAHLLGEAATAMVLTARGSEQHSKGVETVLGFINLTLALGKSGRPGSGYGCLTGQGNGQGAREHGLKADQLPGYRSISNPEHRKQIAAVWGIEEAALPGPGISAYEMLDSAGSEGGIRALLVMGSNPAVSAPHAGRIREKLKALNFLAVSDLFLSETAELADVVLPCAQWAEEEGTTTNLEGRVLLRRRATEPPEGVWTDLEIIAALAQRLGHAERFSASPEQIFQELRRASAGGAADYSGITYERIRAEDGVFWPCPGEDHPGSRRMFLDKFATADGAARFHPVAFRPAAEEPDDDYPLYLTTGRLMAQYQSGTQTRRVAALCKTAPEPFAEIHPVLAERVGVRHGEPVKLVTRRGEAVFAARLTGDIRHDTVFVPFHWGGKASANLLTNPALDPISGMPEFKICAVRLETASAC